MYCKKNIVFNDDVNKEWIITNGIGGYSSSSIIGANTRKYHGLLIASLMPPGRRFVLLSKLDESITINEKKHNLYTNICENYISDGYKYQVEFNKEYIPEFKYQVQDIQISKKICMEYGKNTVVVCYKIRNGTNVAKLELAPVLNFRDFHTMSTNHNFTISQEVKKRKVKIVIDKNSSTPIYINSSEGNYIKHNNDIFKNMFYIEEEKRGFFPIENHVVSGHYEIEIMPNEEKEVTFVCSLEENIDEIDGKKVIENEIKRLDKIIDDTKINVTGKNKYIKDFILATDNFIVYRPNFRLHTVIAGYPWFLDWGRDTLVAFEGLLLITKRFDIAKEVLLTFIRDIKFGLVPNGYSGFDNRPLYNSVDSSLLLFEQIEKYIRYTKDYDFVKLNFYDILKHIIQSYTNGIDLDDNNIYLDNKDGLLVSGTPNTQNTWMDAKYANYAVTPRNGKAVEINAMWYNALKIMEELCKKFGDRQEATGFAKLARKCKKSFKEQFYNKRRKCLYDVIGDGKIRPNQLFSISLTYKVLDADSEIAKEMFETVTKKLYTKHGLRTLAPTEKEYIAVYEGDSFRRDMSYHQGITWPWLFGIYVDAMKAIIVSEKDREKKEKLQKRYESVRLDIIRVFKRAICDDKCIGNIAELYDSKMPYLAKGAIAQAWSVAEIFRIIMEK